MKKLILYAVVCGLGMASVAAEHLEERTSQAGTNDCPNLPEIYLIGDSIRMGYCKDVAKALEGKASVKWPQGNCANSQNILISLGWWRKCASAEPTVIQFNCGHWDVSNWDNDDGPITSLEEYRRNVRMIIRRLRRYYPTSKLVFATTTPMKPGLGKVAVARRTTEEIVRYNAAAVAVAKEEGIAVNDLFAVAKDWPATEFADYCHFKAPANEKLGKAVADFMKAYLPSGK